MSKVSQLHPVHAPCPLPVGSSVSLRGGGVVMTVCEEYEPMQPVNRWFVQCCWHNEVGDACCEKYQTAALYEVDDDVEGRAVVFKEAAL